VKAGNKTVSLTIRPGETKFWDIEVSPVNPGSGHITCFAKCLSSGPDPATVSVDVDVPAACPIVGFESNGIWNESGTINLNNSTTVHKTCLAKITGPGVGPYTISGTNTSGYTLHIVAKTLDGRTPLPFKRTDHFGVTASVMDLSVNDAETFTLIFDSTILFEVIYQAFT
jgi:hypothetical protein